MADTILMLFLDGLMALLLMITVFYCWKLNRRIRILQDSRSELARVIRQFDESTQDATKAITEIHQATRNITDTIQMKIDKASFLADDLEIMIERGNKMSGRLAVDTDTAPKRPARDTKPARSAASPRRAAREEAVEVESVSPEQVEEGRRRGRQKASLESVLKKVSGGKEEQESLKPKRGARLRSKAEQELFEALKTGNQ